MPLITKLMEIIVLHVWSEFITSLELRTDFRVAIQAVSQQQIDEINECMDRIPELQDLEDISEYNEMQLETKATRTYQRA